MRWNYTPVRAESVASLASALGTTPVVAELLLRAGLEEPAAATRFLSPTLATLGDPFRLTNLEDVGYQSGGYVAGEWSACGVSPMRSSGRSVSS